MIRRLRRRMTLMVIAVLILVSSGIVLAISLANSHSIAAQAEETLAVLTENAGAGENRMQRPDGSMDPRGGRMNRDRRGFRGEPPEIRSGRDAAAAGLNNSYTISLNADGSVASWDSDRPGLYTDEQVAVIAESILADGRNSGRIGTQFYRKTEQSGQTLLTVLDARLDYLSASNVLRSTILIAAAACVLLSLLAWLLIQNAPGCHLRQRGGAGTGDRRKRIPGIYPFRSPAYGYPGQQSPDPRPAGPEGRHGGDEILQPQPRPAGRGAALRKHGL